jgi:DNA adenine methylase
MSVESIQSISVKPVAPYFGGKRLLARTVIDRLSRMDHHTYAEPFIGMGGVFLRRPTTSPVEIINDRSRDVATLFRVLQRHFQAFVDMLRWQVSSRAEFDRLMKVDADTLTDLERSARFLYLQKTAFGGKISGRNFGVSKTQPARFDITRIVPMLEDVHHRLAGVTIECLDWTEFLKRYDSQETLFYLDPPYWGCEGEYGRQLFSRADFARMAEQLATIKGRFILSLNDVEGVRQTFKAFTLEPVKTTYSVSAGASSKANELLISNVW